MTRLAAVALLLSGAAAVWSFGGIVRAYRVLRGFPWLLSAIFAAAAGVAVLALYVLLRP